VRGIDDARIAPPAPPGGEGAAPPGAPCEESRRALDLAYRALGVRDRTEAELRRFLERRRVEPATIDAVVAELERAGYVDDARYARLFAEDKRGIARWGSERIERDLRRRGVAEELIAEALAGQAHGSELELAAELLGERFGALASDRDRDRAWRLLVRRGFEPELAYEAVRRHERSLRDAA
jgi:regulatory protein